MVATYGLADDRARSASPASPESHISHHFAATCHVSSQTRENIHISPDTLTFRTGRWYSRPYKDGVGTGRAPPDRTGAHQRINAPSGSKGETKMKRLVSLILSVVILLGLSGTAAAQTANGHTFQDLLPKEIGNNWSYELSSGTVGPQEHRIEVLNHSGGWTYFTGLPGMPDGWVWESDVSARAWVWNFNTSTYAFWLDLGAGAGNTTAVSPSAGLGCWDGAVYTVVDENRSHVSPVGTFNDCLIIELTQGNCVDAGITSVVFAPNVGILEYTEQSIVGPRTYSLFHALVNGTEYERQTSGLTTAVTIDKAVYKVSRAAKGWTEPDTLRIRLSISNAANWLLRYTYYTGQEFDVAIEDERGDEIYRWSWGRGFILPVIARELEHGETLTFETDFELRNNDPNFNQNGIPLAPGKYRITMNHMGIGLEVEATSVFVIQER